MPCYGAGASPGAAEPASDDGVDLHGGHSLDFLFWRRLDHEVFWHLVTWVRIAGGLVLAGVGIGMLKTDPPDEVSEESKQEAQTMRDIAFTPLVMPSLAGPGAIAVVITMASGADVFAGHLAVTIGIILVAVIAWVVLRTASAVVKFLGTTGLNALTRVMGLLLVCVDVQFVVMGVYGFFLDESFAGPIIEMIDRLQSDG